MTKRPVKPLFSPAQMAAFSRELQDLKPPKPDMDSLAAGRQAVSFSATAFNAGLVVRMRFKGGSEELISLNPVLARHLASCAINMGQDAGWLDGKANIIVPPMPELDS